jgi:hypothetical protein
LVRNCLLLAFLSVLAYAPFLSLPLLEDDYPILTEGQTYGSPAALPALLHTPVYRQRAVRHWTAYALWEMFHLKPAAYHVATLLLHIANTCLLYWLLWLWPRMRPAALWAAIFFAVQEGHQEAVVWFSAVDELWKFLFGLGALALFLVAEKPGRHRWLPRTASVVLFALAMISKESAVILPALFFLAIPPAEWRRAIPRLLPYVILAALAAAAIFAAQSSSFRFSDGSFSLHAPFWITWPKGIARLLWIWGWLALVLVRRNAWPPIAWMAVALIPYSFLTYSTEIPSRQTYLASAGLALLAGLAISLIPSRKLAVAVLALIVVQNVAYLWTKKRTQFLRRAEPTEQLIRFARETPGPIWIRCFPRNGFIAEEAVRLGAGKPVRDVIWNEKEAVEKKAAEFCYQQ